MITDKQRLKLLRHYINDGWSISYARAKSSISITDWKLMLLTMPEAYEFNEELRRKRKEQYKSKYGLSNRRF